jgi:hypothetical protein
VKLVFADSLGYHQQREQETKDSYVDASTMVGLWDSLKHQGEPGASDPILTRMAEEDKVPWYQKPNLRYLYLMLFPTCMGIELTSGFDSQMINALQIIPAWDTCECKPLALLARSREAS